VNPFQSLHNYEEFIYTLAQHFASVLSSTLVVARRGATIASVSGELLLHNGYRLSIRERLVFEEGVLRIVRYSYEVWHDQSQLYWYDPQPHPHIPELAATHPHHKHVPPNIKHNRILAPELSFTEPNLPFLIREVEGLIDVAVK
jgi:hypothetical protein